jgi:hypothetical protein
MSSLPQFASYIIELKLFHGYNIQHRNHLNGCVPVIIINLMKFVYAVKLRLCKVLRSHGGDYEECRLLRCYAVFSDVMPSGS